MEFNFFLKKGITTKNDIYIDINDEISLDNLISKLISIGNIAKNNKIILNLDDISIEHLKNYIIDFITIQTYNYKKRELIQNITMPGKSIIGSIINETRYIIDSPPNIMNINTITEYIQNNTPSNVKITIIEEDELIKLNMNYIVNMNKGSEYPAKMIVLTYQTIEENPVVLVGKGVIFDSGGLNIKRGNFSDMKCDKTGAIYVWGLIKALSLNNVDGHFIGLLPLIENMPGSGAVHPGDILRGCNDKTVEVVNTDAEGRLILADALCWANKNINNPKLTIDIATLTGTTISIFGSLGTALMSNKSAQPYVEELIRIGDNTREYYWPLPLHRIFQKYLNSDVADYRNHSDNISAGTIMAGMFLAEFAPKDTPWIHLDIAGVAYRQNATGEPMLSLYYFLAYL
jgi:leucyl aminopeptidase